MNPANSKYSLELYTPSGNLLIDLSSRARNRKIIQSRNQPEEISWTLNLDELEAYCRRVGQNITPSTLLIPNFTEVRVKRLGSYMCGGQIVYTRAVLNSDDRSIEIKATGFLNLFAKRFTGTTPSGTVQQSFSNVQATTIAANLITQSQALTYGDYGVTVGLLANVGTHDRNYSRTNIKDALQALTTVQTNPFDFEFTYDKVFNTYARLGSDRPDIVFEYPGTIQGIAAPNDATVVANEIIGLGQGLGDDSSQAIYIAGDTISQSNYFLRQDTFVSNATDNSDDGLTDATTSRLESYSIPYNIPTVNVDGNRAPYVTDYGVGDTIGVKVNGYDLFSHINGMYRIEKRTITIDENDNESVNLEIEV